MVDEGPGQNPPAAGSRRVLEPDLLWIESVSERLFGGLTQHADDERDDPRPTAPPVLRSVPSGPPTEPVDPAGGPLHGVPAMSGAAAEALFGERPRRVEPGPRPTASAPVPGDRAAGDRTTTGTEVPPALTPPTLNPPTLTPGPTTAPVLPAPPAVATPVTDRAHDGDAEVPTAPAHPAPPSVPAAPPVPAPLPPAAPRRAPEPPAPTGPPTTPWWGRGEPDPAPEPPTEPDDAVGSLDDRALRLALRSSDPELAGVVATLLTERTRDRERLVRLETAVRVLVAEAGDDLPNAPLLRALLGE